MVNKHDIKTSFNDITVKHFPELLSKNINLIFPESKKDYYMQVSRIFFIHMLNVDRSVAKMPKEAMIGCLVHELCHILNWDNNERETDTLVIQRGFGKYLLEFVKYHNSKFEKYTKKEGLSKKEIKQLLLIHPQIPV